MERGGGGKEYNEIRVHTIVSKRECNNKYKIYEPVFYFL